MKKLKSSDDPIEPIPELPTEVIHHILLRLPLKTCLTCKLVCKDWYNLIISDDFAEFSANRETLLLDCKFPNQRKNFVMVDIDKSSTSNVDVMGNIWVGVDAMIKFKSKFDVPRCKLSVLNVCNGLVCLESFSIWGPFYVCNLLTSLYVKVEQSREQHRGLCCRGLGFCQVTRRYKILRVVAKKGCVGCVAEILVVGTNEWRDLGEAPLIRGRGGAFMNGALHWYERSRDTRGTIWAFNFADEKFSRLSPPAGFEGGVMCGVTVLDSCLCFSCTYHGDRGEVWLMKEYGVHDSWVRLFVTEEKGVWSYLYRPWVRMDDGQILASHCGNLVFYDQETRAYRKVRLQGASISIVGACDVDFSVGALQGM